MARDHANTTFGDVKAHEGLFSRAMGERLAFMAKRFGERLWVKPLLISILSVAAVMVAELADHTTLDRVLPGVTSESLSALLSIMAASMLVIATFAVASMVSAYASASTSATPRAFTLVVADDVSQNALSTFIGAFIFSIVALTAVKNGSFAVAGRAALFVVTILVFAIVILTFVRWVDRIARLGRVGPTIQKVEDAATAAITARRAKPTLCGIVPHHAPSDGRPIEARKTGYVQRVDVGRLQRAAEEANGWIMVAALPGTFAMHGRPLAYVGRDQGDGEFDAEALQKAFTIGNERLFDQDPRFGLVVLSEIGDKALSPGINDPGTAIAIVGCMARLFTLWAEPADKVEDQYDRVGVPPLDVEDMFDDAFTAIARDGAGAIEVVLRLLKVLAALASLGDPEMRRAAKRHGRAALARAEAALTLPDDVARARRAASFATS